MFEANVKRPLHRRRFVAGLVLVAHALAFSHVALVLHSESTLGRELVDAGHELHCAHDTHAPVADAAPAQVARTHAEQRCEAVSFTHSSSLAQSGSVPLNRSSQSFEVAVHQGSVHSPPVALLRLAPKLSPPA